MTTLIEPRLYRTDRMLTRTLRVAYPAGRGQMVLRTEQDWDRSLEPVAVSEDGNVSTFVLEADQPFLYFKPCLVESGTAHWAVGPNKLAIMTEQDVRVVVPVLLQSRGGTVLQAGGTPIDDPRARPQLRGYLPPGYDENTLSDISGGVHAGRAEPFLPGGGVPRAGLEGESDRRHPSRDERGRGLHHPGDLLGRSDDGVHEPGYEVYARSLAEEIVPEVERRGLRVSRHRRHRSVWGSSLGGVVSFYTVWEHPDVFGIAVCMSSTFSHRDDLIDRVLTEPFGTWASTSIAAGPATTTR